VAADLVARFAARREREPGQRGQRAREEPLLDAARDLQLAVLALLLDPHAMELHRLKRRERLAPQAGGELAVLLGERGRLGAPAQGEEAEVLAARDQTHHVAEARRLQPGAHGPGRQAT